MNRITLSPVASHAPRDEGLLDGVAVSQQSTGIKCAQLRYGLAVAPRRIDTVGKCLVPSGRLWRAIGPSARVRGGLLVTVLDWCRRDRKQQPAPANNACKNCLRLSPMIASPRESTALAVRLFLVVRLRGDPCVTAPAMCQVAANFTLARFASVHARIVWSFRVYI